MIRFRCNGKLYAVCVADLRKELARIMANFGRGAMTQATK